MSVAVEVVGGRGCGGEGVWWGGGQLIYREYNRLVEKEGGVIHEDIFDLLGVF